MRLPVLMYHAIEDGVVINSDNFSFGELPYVITKEKFEKQIEYLYKNGYKAILTNDIKTIKRTENKVILITFDDGHETNYTIAYPILKKYSYKAIFFITTAWTNTTGYMNEEKIKKLAEEGMEIGSHSVTHRYLNDLKKEEIREELLKSKEYLEHITKKQVISFSAPGGRINNSLRLISRELGYKAIYSSIVNYYMGESLEDIPRISVKREINDKIFYEYVKGNELALLKTKLVVNVLKIAKTILGNRGYDQFRNSILLLKNNLMKNPKNSIK